MCHRLSRLLLVLTLAGAESFILGQVDQPLGRDPYFTVSGNFEAGYRKTQFFQANHNAVFLQWDSRLELWPPPNRKVFAYGPYLRLTGIAASKSEAWENAWLGGPGIGFQMYLFSAPVFSNSTNPIVKALGPTRFFAEHNWMDYWGLENAWRPRKQTRFGAEHWRSIHVNDVDSPWWTETWNGLWWQSANEFDPAYKSWIFANAVRSGVRDPHSRAAAFTPYVAIESSLTANHAYYWENRLVVGGGLRFAPSLIGAIQSKTRLNRFALFAEYLHVAAYYHLEAPSTTPNHEVRAGLTFSTGVWYH